MRSSTPTGPSSRARSAPCSACSAEGVKLGPEGEIKPYGGGLFDPGATATIDRLAWGNATIADVLEALTVVPAPRGQVGKVRLSYRELNVEQLGSIYEGLLELAPAYAHERLWEVELDTRLLHLTDAQRETIRDVRGEIDLPGGSSLDLIDAVEDELEKTTTTEDESADETEESEDGDVDDGAEEKPKRKTSAKKPLKVLREIKAGQVYPRGGQKRKQSGSYYTNRTFVEFLVREALDPKAEGKSPQEILALKVSTRRWGRATSWSGPAGGWPSTSWPPIAARSPGASPKPSAAGQSLNEDDLLVQAGVPDELRLVWGRQDDEQLLAVCRLLVAGHCLYGVDKNPLAVDLAKASLWLITAASGLPLTFLDHRLRCGDSLLGIPAEEVVRPWIEPQPAKGKSKARKTTDDQAGRALDLAPGSAGDVRLLRPQPRGPLPRLPPRVRLLAGPGEGRRGRTDEFRTAPGEVRRPAGLARALEPPPSAPRRPGVRRRRRRAEST